MVNKKTSKWRKIDTSFQHQTVLTKSPLQISDIAINFLNVAQQFIKPKIRKSIRPAIIKQIIKKKKTSLNGISNSSNQNSFIKSSSPLWPLGLENKKIPKKHSSWIAQNTPAIHLPSNLDSYNPPLQDLLIVQDEALFKDALDEKFKQKVQRNFTPVSAALKTSKVHASMTLEQQHAKYVEMLVGKPTKIATPDTDSYLRGPRTDINRATKKMLRRRLRHTRMLRSHHRAKVHGKMEYALRNWSNTLEMMVQDQDTKLRRRLYKWQLGFEREAAALRGEYEKAGVRWKRLALEKPVMLAPSTLRTLSVRLVGTTTSQAPGDIAKERMRSFQRRGMLKDYPPLTPERYADCKLRLARRATLRHVHVRAPQTARIPFLTS